MPKIKHVRINTDDLHKLRKHGNLRVGNFVIDVSDLPVRQVKIYGVNSRIPPTP
jgi:hypothetical protein